MPNPYISQITLPNAQTYDIKDAQARADIASIQGTITGAMHFLGVSSTEITDGGDQDPTIGGNVYSMNGSSDTGGVVIYNPGNDSPELEFVWNGTAWQEFGSTSNLGAMAYADTASTSYTPQGTVTQPSFTGSASDVTLTVNPSSSSSGTEYQPAGTVSQPTFSNGSVTASGTFTPTGSVSVSTNAVSNKTAEVSPASSGTATYTPSGSVSAPTISVDSAGTTTTVNSITAVGTLPSWSATVTAGTETLTISWSQGTLPTKGSDTTVKTGDASYTASTPTFTGTGVRLVTGNIPVPSTYTASFTGTSDQTINVSGTATGTVSQPSFTGTKVKITGTTTAAGTVSQPTFAGTGAMITVSPDGA